MSRFLFSLLAVLFLLSSCTNEARERLRPRKTAFGPMNQLVVVADQPLWNNGLEEVADYYFAGPYPVLPQPEPIFSIRYFSPEDLDAHPERKELRSYVFLVNLNDTSSQLTKMAVQDIEPAKLQEVQLSNGFKTIVGKDKWADGQLLVYMLGHGMDQLTENVKENYAAIIKRVQKSEWNRVDASVFIGGENEELKNELRRLLQLQMRIPVDYFRASYNEELKLYWIRRETNETSSHIFVRKLPYTGKEQLTPKYLKKLRDEQGELVSSEIPDTYIYTNDVDLPMLTEVSTDNGYYTLEARGIWEMENDFMAGPFLSLLIHNPSNNELVFIDGLLFAPGEHKRGHMQQIEHIMRTLRF